MQTTATTTMRATRTGTIVHDAEDCELVLMWDHDESTETVHRDEPITERDSPEEIAGLFGYDPVGRDIDGSQVHVIRTETVDVPIPETISQARRDGWIVIGEWGDHLHRRIPGYLIVHPDDPETAERVQREYDEGQIPEDSRLPHWYRETGAQWVAAD